MHGLCIKLCGKKAAILKIGEHRAMPGMSVINCTFISYYLPVDLLWLPSGTARPPPLHKVKDSKLPFLDD